jgi:F-type H+-transporting ATPase subunit gamma
MSDTAAELRRQIDSATDLQAVVRTMKAMAASSIGQYENAVRALDAYYGAVQLALAASFRQPGLRLGAAPRSGSRQGVSVSVVFGSDQGLVGPFNDAMAQYVVGALGGQEGPHTVWAVGERMAARLEESPLQLDQRFALPSSIDAITPLVEQIVVALEAVREKDDLAQVFLFHHRPQAGAGYAPNRQRLLPLDAAWQRSLAATPWPTGNLPEVMHAGESTLRAFVAEYLFVSLYQSCAESLASENASRLAAMQRAEKNIDEMLEDLNQTFHRMRQSGIDEELFDLVSGYEAMQKAA